ncbi:MAG: hypothetical protein KGS72_23020 [Cyanobacteria bacterium REEB67]|nr:hypothetical protein [Cyanobacteria bacterium REEB67]
MLEDQTEIGEISPPDQEAPVSAEAIARPENSLTIPVLFLLAFVVRLWFNLSGDHPNAYASCDASEYLRYTSALANLLKSGFTADAALQLKEFVITGPSLPVFLLSANLLTGQPYDIANSTIPLIAQSFISALTAVLIYLTAKRLYDPSTALKASALAVFYPAFIVNSGRLYSETFAAFIEMLALFLLVRGCFDLSTARRTVNNLALGASLVVLQLSRSAMILLSAAAIPIVFLQGLLICKLNWQRAAIQSAILLTGAAAMLAPWLIFENQAYHKMTLVVDRVGHYNLFVGTNSRIQGFLSYPYPDGRGIEAQSFPALLKRSFQESPSRFFKLALDKPARLFKAPWNDFRTAVGAIDYKWQVAYHQILILLALLGMLLACVTDKHVSAYREPRIAGRLTLLLAFALHLPYLVFITVPRYNLTAMPMLIIFAAAGLETLLYLNRTNPLAKTPKALLITALALIIFLRDDLKDAFSIGQAQIATIYAVQGQDVLSRGLISAAFGIAFFISIYLSIAFLHGYRKLARLTTVILALITLPLLALPQRANGRPGENIITLARPGETLIGSIKLKGAAAPNSGDNEQWYLLIDCADPSSFARKLQLTVNGKRLTGPFIPGIAALDDWTYLKTLAPGHNYLECEYIYDCLTQPAALTNLDLRQWFYLPLPPQLVDEARSRGALDIAIKQNSTEPSTIYAASTKSETVTIPSRDIYSWEKCFYGVENDSGLTDSRYDEKVKKRPATWKINFDKNSDELSALDLNVRLLCQPGEKTAAQESTAAHIKKDTDRNTDRNTSTNTSTNTSMSTSSGEASLPLASQAAGEGDAFTLLRATIAPAPPLKSKKNASILTPEILAAQEAERNPANRLARTPLLSLEWLDSKGKKTTMRLPWMKYSADGLDVAIPCDLSRIKGSEITLKAKCPAENEKESQEASAPTITLSARRIAQHPLFGQGQLF